MRWRTSQPSWDIFGVLGRSRPILGRSWPILADLGPAWPDLGPILGQSWAILAVLRLSEGPLGTLLGPKMAQDGRKMDPRWPKTRSKNRAKTWEGCQNHVLTLLNRSRTLLDAIFSASSASFSHLQRSEADLTPHVRSVLALLHPNEPRKAL